MTWSSCITASPTWADADGLLARGAGDFANQVAHPLHLGDDVFMLCPALLTSWVPFSTFPHWRRSGA